MSSKIEFMNGVRELEALYRADGCSVVEFENRLLYEAISGDFPIKERYVHAVEKIHCTGNQWYLRDLCGRYNGLSEHKLVSIWSEARKSENWLGEPSRVVALMSQAETLENTEREQELADVRWSENLGSVRAFLSDDFENADYLVSELDGIDLNRYESEKAAYLKELLLPYPSSEHLSKEQLVAIGNCDKSVLLRARAGSGKTTVIKHKVNFVLRHLGYSVDEVMVLAFNKAAASKVKADIRHQYNNLLFDNARTFHSLAHGIVKPTQTLLYDAESGSNAKQSGFVENLLAQESNPRFRKDLYEFFRCEFDQMSNIGSLLSKDDFYLFRRSSGQETLKGEFVKSKGEKWLADFLFEHGLRYIYERPWYRDKTGAEGNYYPDFSLAIAGKKPDIVIEHWGIDEFDSNKSVPAYWSKTWADYKQEIEFKRNYWDRWNRENPHQPVVFIETSIRDTAAGRVAFEEILRQRFQRIGVNCEKLSQQYLIENVVRRRGSKFSTMCLQFIQKAKKQRLSSTDVEEKISSYKFNCSKERIFATIASRIYCRYERATLNENLIDFDDLLSLAIKELETKRGSVFISQSNGHAVNINQLKWLMIDEYQDFSPLFYELVKSLRRYNKELKLFCVGDDWQAINGFAGSDLRYFSQFDTFFDSATLLNLQNNYRSQQCIVEQGNAFMATSGGAPSIPMTTLSSEPLNRMYINEVWIERRPGFQKSDNQDKRFMTFIKSRGEWIDCDKGSTIARQLKACYRLITAHLLGSTTFMILNRGNSLGFKYENLAAFKEKLKTCFSQQELASFVNFDQQVKCTTAHRSKGEEADIVILLNTVKRKFPMIHPDNELFGVLGVNALQIYREEERLFYVAITRAKQSLYIITEKDRESEFLDRISLSDITFPTAEKNVV